MNRLAINLTMTGILLTVTSTIFAIEPTKELEATHEWKYHISIKALERWMGHDRKKVNANLQMGAQKDTLKYELDLKQDHPDYSGFSSKKSHFYDIKQTQRHALFKAYYEMPLWGDFSVSPFIGAGLHATTIVKHKVVLKKMPNSLGGYIPEYIYRKKTKRGMAYDVGAELAYTFADRVYTALGWELREYVNATLSGKRFNEQKVYLKIGYYFR